MWLVKHRDGGDKTSVWYAADTEAAANHLKTTWNAQYQTDAFYVEEYK